MIKRAVKCYGSFLHVDCIGAPKVTLFVYASMYPKYSYAQTYELVRRISENSTLVIDETEAAVIRRIFDMFLHGVRVRTIKDTLNSENVPCLYKSRQNTVNSKRKNKGLEPTVYKRGNLENMIWRETTIRRILRNPIYIGIQKHRFHEPDPANPTPAYKRTDRKVLEEFEISTPETRIISDEDFYQVSRTFAERRANRNQGIKR